MCILTNLHEQQWNYSTAGMNIQPTTNKQTLSVLAFFCFSSIAMVKRFRISSLVFLPSGIFMPYLSAVFSQWFSLNLRVYLVYFVIKYCCYIFLTSTMVKKVMNLVDTFEMSSKSSWKKHHCHHGTCICIFVDMYMYIISLYITAIKVYVYINVYK